ncbi:hypothetical protein Tco_0983470, partial [Tanacetum coccineum]
MAISVISISSDSFEDILGKPAGRVILFGTIPTTIPDTTPVITLPTTQTDITVIPTETPIIAPTIPPSPDYTPASPDYSPASDSEFDPSEDPSSDHIPPLPAISPFLSSADDTIDSDTPDTSPSPTYVHMMTARKRVGPLPTHRLAMRHFVDHSSSDSSLEASSDFHSDASSDSSLRHSLPDHSSPDLPSTSAGPSRKRCRSPMTSVHALPLDESSEPSRSGGADLEMDVDVVRSDEIEINPEIQAEIEECFAYADALRDRGIDARVVVETVARDDVETGTRDPIIVSDDGDTPPVVPKVTPEPAQEGAAGSTEQGHRIIGVESAVTALTKRIAELERDNW